MTRYTTYEAKARLSEILRKVEDGQRVVITRHGKPTAEIRPFAPGEDAAIARRLRTLSEEGLAVYLGKREGKERFIDTYNRIGIEPFKEHVYAKAD